jgi:type IV pilus assembly protein PilN
MLRINLATRPFYNVRVVQVMLGLAVALVVGLTAFNVTQIVRLGASQSTLGARASQATLEARRLLADADRIRKQIDPQELQVVANAAREANAIIDQRAFSWTDLLAEFEATLPADVRAAATRENELHRRDCRRGPPVGGSRRVHRSARTAWGVPQRAVGAGADQRRRIDPGGH